MSTFDQGAIGIARINDLMARVVDAAETNNKSHLLQLCRSLMEDTDAFIEVIFNHAGVEIEEIENLINDASDEEDIKTAASAEQIHQQAVENLRGLQKQG